MLDVLAGLLALLPSATAVPQAPALVEDFNQAVPPSGWTQTQVNPLAAGWIHSADGRAWHQDESSSLGTCEDYLISPVLNLTAFAAVYAHFEIELAYPDYLENFPGSAGDGETDLCIRLNGGPWVEVWTESRRVASNEVMTVDLTSYLAGRGAVEIALRYYGTFAHATWVDWIQVDADPVAPPPPPPTPEVWTVSLPASFLQLAPGSTLDEGFEAYGGNLPAHMAATRIFADTGLFDPDAWCDIGGGNTVASGGLRCLEMGLIPGTSNYHYARNALVAGYDGTGTSGLNELGFTVLNHGEEVQPFDGIWLSADGLSWYQVYGPWTGSPASWTAATVDLRALRHLTDGPFFLMFAQEDNFPYASLDGVALDDLRLTTGGSGGPVLTRTGACPGTITLSVSQATPLAPVAFFYGRSGSDVHSGQPCQGLAFQLAQPVYAGYRRASAGGAASMTVLVPAFGCSYAVQAVDVASCRITNVVAL